MPRRKTKDRLIRARHRMAHALRDVLQHRPDAQIWYLADGDPEIDGMMESVGRMAGGAYRFEIARISFRDFPETSDQAAFAYKTAKRPPSNKVSAWLKRKLYRGQYNWARAQFAANPGVIALAWNGRTSTRLAYMEAARDSGAARLYMERAPFPGRVTLDPVGINQVNSVPRQRAFFEAWAAEHPDRIEDRMGDGWRAIRAELTARQSSRADVGQGSGGSLPDTNFLFCPLQVPNDTQIRQFSGWVGSIEAQLYAMASAADQMPDGWHLRLKEHPSSRIAFGGLIRELAARSRGRVVLDNSTDTFAQVAASAGVITVNSSVGLQAFFYDRPVMVLGQAFYGQPGLVTLAQSEAEMRRLFRDPGALTFDPAFRAMFMNWLDQEYYVKVAQAPDGRVHLDMASATQKIAMARRLAW